MRIVEFDRRTVIFGDLGKMGGARRLDWSFRDGRVELTDPVSGRRVSDPERERLVARKLANEPIWLERP